MKHKRIKRSAGVLEADIRNFATRASMISPHWHRKKFQKEVGFDGALPCCPLSYGNGKEEWPGENPIR